LNSNINRIQLGTYRFMDCYEVVSGDIELNLLVERIAPARAALAVHPLYEAVQSLADVRRFMQQHVFAVWDFMCLLKGLQRLITCVDVPWVPVGSARTRRLINEIVLEEESDCIDGEATGHFELYLRAMNQIGADTSSIHAFIVALRQGKTLDAALAIADAPAPAAAFVRSTFRSLNTAKPHVIAAAFTFGREDAIPSMFRNLLPTVQAHHQKAELLGAYIERHLLLDEENHGPKAVEMVCDICGSDPGRWEEAIASAEFSLRARLRFWDGVKLDLDNGNAGQPAAPLTGASPYMPAAAVSAPGPGL
jgi:hypothetical protein